MQTVVCDWSPIITINGTVSRNATDTKCSQMITSMVKNIDEQQVLFMGDSTMHMLYEEARALQSGELPSSKIIKTYRCHRLKAFGIKPAKVWNKPNPKKEGPLKYGLSHPGCTDCNGCNTYVVIPKGRPLKQTVLSTSFLSMDYIALDFARDVEMQSVLGNTTQETLSRYLQLEHKTYSLCVLNIGLHDQVIRGFTAKDYVLNVKQLLELFVPVCLHIVWIEMTAPKGNKRYRQRIDKTQDWNIELKSYLDTHPRLNVSMMRVFKKSLQVAHNDNVHLHNSWYKEMARTMFEVV